MQPVIVSVHQGSFAAANGVVIAPQARCDEQTAWDVICVPELLVPPGEPLNGRFADEVNWLTRRYEQGTTLATACSGAILLAEAGLLDGLEATTHRAYADVMRQRYPRVRLRLEAALVATGEGERLLMAGMIRASGLVERIAEDVGYEDAAFFGRLFRRHVGLTAAQYRRHFRTMHRRLAQAAAIPAPVQVDVGVPRG